MVWKLLQRTNSMYGVIQKYRKKNENTNLKIITNYEICTHKLVTSKSPKRVKELLL